ncbi:MAG: Mth938-like domain-containing protein [Hyphomicrobiaceae bacterium]
MTTLDGRYPYQAPIDAYGNGGFRFADMSHRGSLLCLPSGMLAWHVSDPLALDVADFDAVLAAPEGIGFLLLGTGARQLMPPPDLRAAFATAGIGLEPMSTGAAARTYNVLLAERRPVAAALLVVP